MRLPFYLSFFLSFFLSLSFSLFLSPSLFLSLSSVWFGLTLLYTVPSDDFVAFGPIFQTLLGMSYVRETPMEHVDNEQILNMLEEDDKA